MTWQYFGYLCAILGTVYALPQLFRAVKRGNAKGLSKIFLGFWVADKLCSLIYATYLGNEPFIIKYGISLAIVSILCYYKTKPD